MARPNEPGMANWESGYSNVELEEEIYSQARQLGLVVEDTFR